MLGRGKGLGGICWVEWMFWCLFGLICLCLGLVIIVGICCVSGVECCWDVLGVFGFVVWGIIVICWSFGIFVVVMVVLIGWVLVFLGWLVGLVWMLG